MKCTGRKETGVRCRRPCGKKGREQSIEIRGAVFNFKILMGKKKEFLKPNKKKRGEKKRISKHGGKGATGGT